MKDIAMTEDTGVMQREYSVSTEAIRELIIISLSINTMICDFYRKVASSSPSGEIKDFWTLTAAKEEVNIQFWEYALSMAERGMIPVLFDNPWEVQEEIHKAAERTMQGLEQSRISSENVAENFLTAIRLEFYGLHNAIAPLLGTIKALFPGKGYENVQDSRLVDMIKMFNKHCTAGRPDLLLLSDVILRLWRENRELAKQCYVDDLTGLLNRKGFFNAAVPFMELARRNGRSVAIIVADLDNFKMVNDTYGHQTGDRVLHAAGRAFRETMRSSDLCGRYGGEEFIVLCPEIAPGSAYHIAEKLRLAVDRLNPDDLKVTISVGVIEAVPEDTMAAAEELERLIKFADILLYEAKRSGKNCSKYQNFSF